MSYEWPYFGAPEIETIGESKTHRSGSNLPDALWGRVGLSQTNTVAAATHLPVGDSPLMATLMLVGVAWGVQAGLPAVGSIVGRSLVGAALVNVSTGFCILSFIVRIFFGKVTCRADRSDSRARLDESLEMETIPASNCGKRVLIIEMICLFRRERLLFETALIRPPGPRAAVRERRRHRCSASDHAPRSASDLRTGASA